MGVLLGQAGGTFAPAGAYSTGAGTSPRTVALGDVNGDGLLDAVTANANTGSRTVGVLLGQAGGTFAPVVAYSTGAVNDPYFATLGDVNGDGRLDIVTANPNQNTTSVLLGQAGGTFAPVVAYSTGASSSPAEVALADLNGDGRLDIVAGTIGTNLSVGVLLGQTGGTFAPVMAFSTGSGPYGVALGDLNGDGRPDIVTANSNQSTARA